MILRLLLTFILTTHFMSGESQEKGQSMGLEEKVEIATPTYLYIILSKEAWKESLQGNALSLGTENKQFIHIYGMKR